MTLCRRKCHLFRIIYSNENKLNFNNYQINYLAIQKISNEIRE